MAIRLMLLFSDHRSQVVRLFAGVAVAVLFMEDEKGLDSKVVLSRECQRQSMHLLTPEIRNEIADYFGRYKHGTPVDFRGFRVMGRPRWV